MKMVLAAVVLMVLPTAGALAQGGPIAPGHAPAECSYREAMKAEEGADSLKNWAEVYRAFKLYGKCDNGGVAEGYSDSVAKLLAWHWSGVRELSEMMQKDPLFGRFVLSHVDETIGLEGDKAIIANARYHCPPGLEKLCKRIDKVASAP